MKGNNNKTKNHANYKDGSRNRKNQKNSGRDRNSSNKATSDAFEPAQDRRDVKSSLNDISWYTRNPSLIQAAGSFPYPYRPGMILPNYANVVGTSGETPITFSNPGFQLPGVLSLFWNPSIGNSTQLTDPASVTANQVYAKVRQMYSSELAVDPPDFMMYFMALDSVFSYIAYLKRIYRLVDAYSVDNRALPNTLVAACTGLSDEQIANLRSHKTRFWQRINTLVLQSRRFQCPAFMDVFNRHYWMNDNVWLDHPSIRGQMYMFVQGSYLRYKEQPAADDKDTLVSGLEYVQNPLVNAGEEPDTVYYEYGLSLINALTAWDECYTINGYLKRAYEGVPNFIVDEIPMGDPFTPIYSEEVLTQIENATSIPFVRYQNIPITQNTKDSSVICDLTSLGVTVTYAVNKPYVLNLRVDAPTVADTVIASRLCSAVEYKEGNTVVALSCGTEWISGMYLWVQRWNKTTAWGDRQPVLVSTDNVLPSPQTLMDLLTLDQFDWHPFVYVYWDNSQVCVAGDVYNPTVIDQRDMQNLHNVCLYSEFGSFNI